MDVDVPLLPNPLPRLSTPSPMPPDDPLALDADWARRWSPEVSLTPLEQALESTVLKRGLSRRAFLERLATDLHRRQLLPLLWLLPRRWRLAPARLPGHLKTLGGVLERGFLSPALLAAIAEDLPSLLPAAPSAQASALERWQAVPDATDLDVLLTDRLDDPSQLGCPKTRSERPGRTPEQPQGLSGGLVWENRGLVHAQGAAARGCNTRIAQLLNRLGANLLGGDPWCSEGCHSTASWIAELKRRGWLVQARVRASVASFGLGASLPKPGGGWSQVPLALPIRTGLLSDVGDEWLSLLPHSRLELEIRKGTRLLRLQYYQGREGLRLGAAQRPAAALAERSRKRQRAIPGPHLHGGQAVGAAQSLRCDGPGAQPGSQRSSPPFRWIRNPGILHRQLRVAASGHGGRLPPVSHSARGHLAGAPGSAGQSPSEERRSPC